MDPENSDGVKIKKRYGKRGARYLTGENLKVVWAEFSTLS
jgi:hypothetical protein